MYDHCKFDSSNSLSNRKCKIALCALWNMGNTRCTAKPDCSPPGYPPRHLLIGVIWSVNFPSVLWRCRLGGRKGIRPVKTEWWCAGVVICLERGADFHMAQLMPLTLTVSCFSKILIGLTFLVPVHPDTPGKESLNRCVCGQLICLTIGSAAFALLVIPYPLCLHFLCRRSAAFALLVIPYPMCLQFSVQAS